MNRLLKLAVLTISVTMFANFLFTAGVGVYKTIRAYSMLYFDGIDGKPGSEIVESLD